MTNAKEEFLEHTKGKKVCCAKLILLFDTNFTLPVGYTREDYKMFLKEIDQEYDSGYGGQELFGTIWYTDGTWSTRGEYDGSEWWEYNECPEITPDLMGDPCSNV